MSKKTVIKYIPSTTALAKGLAPLLVVAALAIWLNPMRYEPDSYPSFDYRRQLFLRANHPECWKEIVERPPAVHPAGQVMYETFAMTPACFEVVREFGAKTGGLILTQTNNPR